MKPGILVVDDDHIILETMELLLSEAGYEFELVDSGEKCIQKVRDGFKGLVLLDVMMPFMDGWQTIENLVAENLHANIIICMQTAVTDPGQRMHSLAQYVWDYVRKPYVLEELQDAIENAMETLNAQSSIA